MRTRSRSVVLAWSPALAAGTYNYSLVDCNGAITNGTTTISATGSLPRDYVDEKMVDSTGPKGSHACLHRRLRIIKNNDVFFLSRPSGAPVGVLTDISPAGQADWFAGVNYWVGQIGGWDINSTTSIPVKWTIPSLSIDENILKNDVWEKAKQLKADVLLDLVEGNQVWPSIRDLATTLPNIKKHWGNLRKVVKTAASGYLAWKFGVKPLVQDMDAIHKHIGSIRTGLQRHKDGDSHRFSRVAAMNPNFDNTPLQLFTINGKLAYETTILGQVLSSPVLRYVLVVKPTVKYHTKLFASCDYFLSRYATSPASLAWEKIPFSFVVDWFVDLRGALTAIDDSIGFEPFEVVNFTRSVGYKLLSTVSQTRRSPCTGASLGTLPVCTAEYQHYERTLASKGSILPSWKPRFGKNQAGITAALILQRLKSL